MDRFTAGAQDALTQYLEMDARRRALPAKRWPPRREPKTGTTWSPRMSEQERKEHEQYVIDNDLPF